MESLRELAIYPFLLHHCEVLLVTSESYRNVCYSLIRDIDRSIRYRESLKDTPRERQEVFLYDRPHGDHMQAPVGHNMELHKLSVKERDEGWHKKARAADGIRMLP